MKTYYIVRDGKLLSITEREWNDRSTISRWKFKSDSSEELHPDVRESAKEAALAYAQVTERRQTEAELAFTKSQLTHHAAVKLWSETA